MSALLIVGILVGLVALTTAVGLVWKARTGRVRTIKNGNVDGNIVRLAEVPRNGKVTLLQFSTEVCAPCVPTRRVLGQIADATEGVNHVDFDLTHRPDVAAQFNVLQTPTTLILDRTGAIRARIGGAPRRADVVAALETILAA